MAIIFLSLGKRVATNEFNQILFDLCLFLNSSINKVLVNGLGLISTVSSELANNELTTITISDSSKSKDQTLNENKIGTNDSSSPIRSTLADEKLYVSEAEIVELKEEPTEANEIAILSELSSSEIAIAEEMENTSELMDVGLSFEDEIFEADGIRENALIISGSTEPVSAIREKGNATKEIENNAITVCRSLKDDQELIALFFTAL